MADIRDYTLTEILKDARKFDITSLPDYVESVVTIMKWYYEEKEFDKRLSEDLKAYSRLEKHTRERF